MSTGIPTVLDPICVPVNLDAFVLHEKVCDSGDTKIIGLQQPNYVSLRLDNASIQVGTQRSIKSTPTYIVVLIA